MVTISFDALCLLIERTAYSEAVRTYEEAQRVVRTLRPPPLPYRREPDRKVTRDEMERSGRIWPSGYVPY